MRRKVENLNKFISGWLLVPADIFNYKVVLLQCSYEGGGGAIKSSSRWRKSGGEALLP